MRSGRLGNNEVRRETSAGSEYLVAPSALIQEDVYSYPTPHGNLSREYLPKEEIESSTGEWDGQPIFLDHARDEHGIATARPMGTMNDSQVGHIESPKTDDDMLRAEAWIDLSEVGDHDGELTHVVNALDRGETLETSASYEFKNTIQRGGWHDDSSFQRIQTDLRPDHVAVFSPMSHKTGNCSVADGCGIGRANNGIQSTMKNPYDNPILRQEFEIKARANEQARKGKAEQIVSSQKGIEKEFIDLDEDQVERIMNGERVNQVVSSGQARANVAGVDQYDGEKLKDLNSPLHDGNARFETGRANVDEDEGEETHALRQGNDRFEGN
jgi:hypothetical protein